MVNMANISLFDNGRRTEICYGRARIRFTGDRMQRCFICIEQFESAHRPVHVEYDLCITIMFRQNRCSLNKSSQ